MPAHPVASCTAFAGPERIASGRLGKVALACKALVDRGDSRILLIFDDATAEPVELDLRGSAHDVRRRFASGSLAAEPEAPTAAPDVSNRGPGRPRLGVVGREVTLLPRHWEWLNAQPGGASVALRKLVEHARRAGETRGRVRRSQEAAFRFMSAIAGNEPGFEEAARSLFAGDRERFDSCTEGWPGDVREFASKLAVDAFARA
jgi:uncharacterized protein